MTKYQIRTKEELMSNVTRILTAYTDLDGFVQQFLGDFLVSYNTTKDSSPLTTILKFLQTKKCQFKLYQINTWIQSVSNYRIAINEKKNFVLRTNTDDLAFVPNELFETTNFYDIEEESKEKKETTPATFKSEDAAIKAAEKYFDKLSISDLTNLERENVKKALKERLATL